jgi:FkbM family methyltransferase
MRAALIRAVQQLGIYERLKYSPLYEAYLQLLRRDIVAVRTREVAFFRQLLEGLEPGDLIFDLGGNQGFKAEVFWRLGANVICVEPDPSSTARIRHLFLGRRAVTVVEKAVSDRAGTATLRRAQPGSPLNTLSDKWAESLADPSVARFGTVIAFDDAISVATVSVADLVREFGRPFFVKIDVEGHELNVIRGFTEAVPYLSFEVNLPEFRGETLECVRLLSELDPEIEFNHAEDSALLGGWRRVDEFASWLESTSIRYMEVYARSAAAARRQRGSAGG